MLIEFEPAAEETEPAATVRLLIPSAQVARAADVLGRRCDPVRLPSTLRVPGADVLLPALVDELTGVLTTSAASAYGSQLQCATAAYLLSNYLDAPAHATAPEAQAVSGLPPVGGLSGGTLRRVEAYVREHLDKPLPHRVLAAEARLSPWHFAREFKATTGETPAQYVARVRMERARELLSDPAFAHITVVGIGELVGYRSGSAFARTFQRVFGESPGRFRRELGD